MDTTIINHANVSLVECLSPIGRIDDALDLVAACIEQDTSRLLLESGVLPDAFFDLHTKFAGEFVQKLQNYRLRTAAVLPSETGYNERFQEFLVEARRGSRFRVFTTREDALNWLVLE